MKLTLLTTLFSMFLTVAFAQNNGLLFDGSEENLVIDHKPAFNIGSTFTIEAWIYANAWKAESWRGSIVNKDAHITVPVGYAFRCGDNGKLSFVMATDNDWQEVFTESIMNAQQWHHVAVVVENGNMSLYLDGQPIISGTYNGTPSVDDQNVHIGSSVGFPDRNFDGIIDEIRIWDTARSAAEISDNTTTEFTGNEAGLVVYLPMNEGSGSVANNLADGSCNANFNANMDDSNWVDGFSIPDFDVSPSRISGLDVINLTTRPIRLNVDILNSGVQAVTEVPLKVFIDGELVLEESFVGNLASGSLTTYTFFTPLDLTEADDPVIEIQTDLEQDGNTLNNSTSVSVNSPDGNFIRLFDGKQHSFGGIGRAHTASIVLPADLSGYEQMLLHISVSCPTTGCDPWDQPAKIEAVTENGTFEIARYITPYGIACGPWTVDVTDFKSVLGGIVDFRSFIQVWGNSGWLVTIDLELIEGSSDKPFSKISPLWETDYLVYGDPNINDDLSAVNVDVDNNSETSHIRMTISGHGQGNTNNAAEFYNVTHDFMVNGGVVNNHNVWKPDCESNSCSDQAGNWLFDRAGWCPGQAVDPYTVNTTAEAAAGNSVAFDYDLQDYTNLLNTGYNSGSHTEPHYRIWSYFVENSSNRYQDYFNLICDSVSTEVSGSGSSQVLDKISMHISNDGSQPMSNIKVSYFINNSFIAQEDVPGTIAVGESYIHEFSTVNGFSPNAYNKVYGVITQDDDQNSGDNISRHEINANLSGTDDPLTDNGIRIYPNPTSGELINIDFPKELKGGQLTVFDQSGKMILSKMIDAAHLEFSIRNHGVYLVQLQDENGNRLTKKVVVHP